MGDKGSMNGRCLLCESFLPVDTVTLVVTPTTPGTICVTCAALSIAERDLLRTRAMTRMLTIQRRT